MKAIIATAIAAPFLLIPINYMDKL